MLHGALTDLASLLPSFLETFADDAVDGDVPGGAVLIGREAREGEGTGKEGDDGGFDLGDAPKKQDEHEKTDGAEQMGSSGN